MQIFESQPFFAVCSVCGSSLKEGCKDHPDADADFKMILSGIIDDGTENIRAVFFGEQAEKILGMNTKDAKKLLDRGNIKKLLADIEIGREYVIEGKIRRNNFFDRLEFIVSDVKDVDVKDEIEKLMAN